MAEITGIDWTDHTFNPWLGCERVSPGCAHCYADTLAKNRMGLHLWGADAPRKLTSDGNWRKPLTWNRASEHDAQTGEGLGRRHRVFCASMADVFEERPDLEPWRERLFELIAATPSLDWQLLTKRPEFARDWLRGWYEREGLREWTSRDELGWGVLPNVWIGASMENARYTWRADVLREIPATVRFISAEPLLGSLYETHVPAYSARPGHSHKRALDLSGIDWLISGGESGREARPMHPDWARELRDACAEADVPFFHKQNGAWLPDAYGDGHSVFLGYGRSLERVGLDARPEALREPVYRMAYQGSSPKAGGKLLDGLKHCKFPPSADVLAGTLF